MDLVHRELYDAKMKAARPKVLIQPPSWEICISNNTRMPPNFSFSLFLESKKLVICTCISSSKSAAA